MWLVDLLPPYLVAPFLLCALGIGHLAIWVMVINRLHATNLPRPLIKTIDKGIYLAVLAIPAAVVYQLMPATSAIGAWLNSTGIAFALGLYVWFSMAISIGVSIVWLGRRTAMSRNAALVSNHTTKRSASAELGLRPVAGWQTHLAASLPFNQIFDLDINTKTLHVPNLPEALDGLSIAHLSDIHMTGRITQPFFDYVVDRTNELDADLVCITGDIVEKVPCLEWIAPTLGRLDANYGKFFILGNHDLRIRDEAAVRKTLVEAGLTDLGGRARFHSVHGERVLLAGNELPWFGPAPNLQVFEPPMDEHSPFKILLSHSPDQIYWAVLRGFDLMLAGHCHGGQICLPFIGPLVSPSYFGVKYASGLFQEGPTLLHVSRGVSGLEPLRFNCPPELTKLVLVRELPTSS